MRKFVVCVLILLLLLALAAPAWGMSIALPYTRLETLEEYEAFFEKYYFNDDCFVPYSVLQPLGEFAGFGTNATPSGYYTDLSFTYALRDANGFLFRIRVQSHSTEQKIKSRPMPAWPSSSTKNVADKLCAESQTYARDGIYYQCDDGELIAISWNVGVYEVSISKHDKSFTDYPMDGETTLVSRLLSMDSAVAQAAVEEFVDMIPMWKEKPVNPWLVVIGVVCVVGVVAAVIVIRIRRKKFIKELIRSQIQEQGA